MVNDTQFKSLYHETIKLIQIPTHLTTAYKFLK